jgi:3-keto-5-aminohexanoate cleavage enzyme
MTAASLAMGGNVRVGLEDNFYLPNGEMADSNAELVAAAADMTRSVGREPATPDEAREIMELD